MAHPHFFIAGEYLHYLCNASGRYEVHSPFVYDFYTKVILASRRNAGTLHPAEAARKKWISDRRVIRVQDYGSGSDRLPEMRKVSQIASSYACSPRKGRLLSLMAAYFNTGHVLELGTSVGISALYFASAPNRPQVTTLEGCPQTLALARETFSSAGVSVHCVEGPFNETLLPVLRNLKSPPDLVFFDGNHRSEPTLDYFNTCMGFTSEEAVYVFDDIHASPGMKQAWQTIISHPVVSVSIDLFGCGIVFFRKKIARQHFVLRY